MAEEPQEEPAAGGEEQESASRSPKGNVKLLGGVVGVIAAGAMAAFMALPKKAGPKLFDGPFSFDVINEDSKISANTRDNNNKRYLQLEIHCEFYAYEKTYLETRSQDELYKPALYSEISRLISDKRLAEALVGTARETFSAELLAVLDPILFPVHVGATSLPHDKDVKSGLRPGLSYRNSTFRGRFHDNVLKVDAVAKTMQLNEGPVCTFEGGEEDFVVTTTDGELVHLDLTHLEADFQGEVEIGIRGRIRRLNLPHMIGQ